MATSKQSGMEVVDIPENVKMQSAMQEVRKRLNAMDVILQEYNKYQYSRHSTREDARK